MVRVALGVAMLGGGPVEARGAAARTVDVNAPHGTRVPIQRPNPLAVLGIPHARLVVLCAGQEEVALAVVLDHRQRPLMALDDDGPHLVASSWRHDWL